MPLLRWAMRRRPLLIAIVAIALIAAAPLARVQPSRPAPCTALTHAVVVNPAAESIRDATVVVCGDTIQTVSLDSHSTPATARILDERGRFLVPGLWDMHVHLDQVDDNAGTALVAAGVTTVRDVGSPFPIIRRWRERTASGQLIAPHIRAAGAMFESPRFVGLVERLAARMPQNEGSALRALMRDRTVVDDAGSIEDDVAALAANGAEFIKVRNVEQPEWMYLFAAAAKHHGLPLAAHVIPGVDLARASAEGVRSFEHYDYRDAFRGTTATDDHTTLADALKRNGTVLVPTLVTRQRFKHPPDEAARILIDRRAMQSAGVSARMLQLWKMKLALADLDPTPDWLERWTAGVAFLRSAHHRGVTILAGTDLGVQFVYPGTSLIDELEMFAHNLEMTPAESLAAATIEPARWFGLEQSVGIIAPERQADIVVLGSDPLARIENLRDVRGVMLGGVYYEASELRRLLNR
jgi:imidazolonepropionase-like amidohydrolase